MPTKNQATPPSPTTTSPSSTTAAGPVQHDPIPSGAPATSAKPARGTPIGGSGFQYAINHATGEVMTALQPSYNPTTGELVVGADGKPVMTMQPVPWTAQVQHAGVPITGGGIGGVGVGYAGAPYTEDVLPRYYEGDAEVLFNDLPPAARAQLQDEMIAAGVYGAKNPNIVHGIFDQETATAFKQVLTTANATGNDYRTVIQNYKQFAASQPPPPPTPHVATISSTTDLVKTFKDVSRNALGRELSDSEAKRYASVLQGQEAAADQAKFAMQDAGTSGTVMGAPSPSAFLDEQLKQNQPGEYGANRLATTFDTFQSLLKGPAL